MPAWSWFVIAAVVVICRRARRIPRHVNGPSQEVRATERHFGPEYERAVGEAGDQRAAEKELVARERERQKLDIVALAPESRAKYAEHWRAVQTAFVDNPSAAVGDADRLVTAVMRERGYPVDDFDQRAPISRSITPTLSSIIGPLHASSRTRAGQYRHRGAT